MNSPDSLTRRDALKTLGAGAALLGLGGLAARTGAAETMPGTPGTTQPFALPKLDYAYDALEPHIDARTMEIHHDKHHAAYVTNLNKAVAEFPELGRKQVEDLLKDLNAIPEKVRTAVRNQGGGHFNHTLFWQMMKKDGDGEPNGELANAINKSFGSFSGFKEKLTDTATKVFGSGWAWLIMQDGNLKIESAPNQDNPVSQGKQPLLGIDVWEHAYYLKYQNRRPEYVAAWLNVINWDFVADRYSKLKA